MRRTLALILVLAFLPSCKTAYYGTMAKFGWEKRDLLVSRVKKARDGQQAAKEQFRDALEKFQSVVKVEGGDLQKKYDQLRSEYDASDSRAKAVRDRIASVEVVSKDLFAEWKNELGEYKNPDLRRASEEQLRRTQRRYDELIDAMHRAESKMDPVLSALHDQVLFLKHNLNARAIASLQGTTGEIESDVAKLIQEMEAAIKEADAFIAEMGNTEKPKS